MLIGHYAVALAAKKFAPRTSLGALVAAAALLDLIWPVLVLAGVETVAVAPGNTAFTPLDFINYPWSHSLVTSIAWGAIFAAAYFSLTRYRNGALAIFLLVPSHWVLDFIVHRPDLPLIPGGAQRLGLGLWNSVLLTLVIELAMFALGVLLYLQTTRPRDPKGVWGFWIFVVLLLGIYAAAVFGPPPPSAQAVAYTDLGQFLFIALAWWVDVHRTPR